MCKNLRVPLLLVTMLLTYFAPYAQIKDVASYATNNGIFCKNLWEMSRVNGEFSNHYLANNYVYIRAATIWGEAGKEKIVFAWSKPYSFETGEVDSEGNPVVETRYNGTLIFLNFYTGEMEKEVTLKYNDEPITGLLCTNSIGVDDAGNLWVGSYVGATENDATPLKLHVVTDPENGICGTRWDLVLPANEASTSGRIEYCDVAGDITGETMDGLCMASLNATANYVYRWRLFQGDVEWMGDFEGRVCWDLEGRELETYPANVTAWSTSECKIVKDPNAAWEYFYVDGFYTCPSLYAIDRSYVDGFSNATDLSPAVGTVGITEFSIKGKNFIAYSKNYYSSTPGCQVGIAELVPNWGFKGMQEYWLLPANGLGSITDGGIRRQSIATINVKDSNGKEGVYLLSYRVNNGVAVYLIAEEGFEGREISQSVAVSSVSLNNVQLTLTKGATSQLITTILPENATNKTLSWKSSNTSVATVSANGLVTAINTGTAYIIATSTDGSNISATCAVNVTDESSVGPIATAISVPNNLSLNIGEQTSIAVTVIPNTAKLTSISYSSSNSSVAKVSSSGVITALTAGTAKITVTGTSSNGNTLTATSTVNVIDNTRNPDLASGIYLSILGFNNDLYSYPFKQLSSWSKSGFESFINGLTTKNGTILYYSVEQALKQLKSSQYPTDISNISIVTFTDGLDQGSHMKNTSYGSDDAYLNAINNKINNELVSSLPVSAYSIGVVGDDVTDISKFRKNLQALASSADNAIEVSNMDEVNSKFQDIANKLIETSNIQTISVIMPGQANGTKVRFTFDGVSSASSSTLYIEGTFNLSDFSLNNITYKGMKATSDSKIIGEVVDGIFIKFTFEGIETDSKLTIQQQDINEWTYITSTSSWQVNSEFDKDEQSEIETRKQSAAVILVLDCSSSLGSQFTNVQQCANSFIATLAYHSVERNQDLLSMIGYDELIKVDGGTFMMGAQSGNSTGANYDTDAQSAESPVHQVTLDDFCIGKYEVTQRLWEYVMTYSGEAADGTKMMAYSGNVWPNGNPTSAYGLGDNHPAYNVSYQNIVNIFIPRLNQITGKSFRLPTEAEWEYAARGGLMSKGYKYSGSNTANSVAWTKSNSTLSQRVGMKSPNELGLYDMSGNVSEWCSSKYTNYSSSAQINPADYTIENEQLQTKASSTPSISGGTGIITPSYSVRGGDYTGAISTCRVSSRSNSKSNQYYIGFRLALSIEPVKATKLTLDKTTATISVDEEIQLIATIEPGNTDNKSITWTSSDENVATVDENGVVTAISAGSVIITAKTSDGSNLSASCEIKVVTSSIEDIMNNNELYEVARYDLFGRKLSQPTKGINIIKMNDGSVLKQYVK